MPIQSIAKVAAELRKAGNGLGGRQRTARQESANNCDVAGARQRDDFTLQRKVEQKAEMGSSPISRVLSSEPILRSTRRAIIPLVGALPRRSSSLPGDSASSVDVPLFGLAPDGVCRAVRVTTSAVGSYPAVSPLPDLRRAIGGLLSVALSVALTRRLWRPAVSRHPALWGPDFPRCANTPRLPGELPGAEYSRFAARTPTLNPDRAASQHCPALPR